jgi:acyl-CoA reductase-like NAD-dependent aldehyde dehydrogenase
VSDIFLTKPDKWRQMNVQERLEFFRKRHCTGPCGASQSAQAAAHELSSAIKEAIGIIAEHRKNFDLLCKTEEYLARALLENDTLRTAMALRSLPQPPGEESPPSDSASSSA